MPLNLPLSTLEQHDEFIGRHIGPCASEIAAMLAAIGADSLDQLIDQTVPTPIRLDRPSPDIAESVGPIRAQPLSQISYGQVLIDIVRVGTRYEVRLPRELVLVAKQMLYFERYGQLYLRDGVQLSLAKRQIAEKLIDLENTERKTLVFTIADGNGRRDAQPEVWELMRSRWNQQWKSGWWLRDADGKWSRKP